MASEMGCQQSALQLFAGWRETEYMTIAIPALCSQYGRICARQRVCPFSTYDAALVWKLTPMHSFLGGGVMSSMTYNG